MPITINTSILGLPAQNLAGSNIIQRNPVDIRTSFFQRKAGNIQNASQGINQAQAMKNSRDTTQITSVNPFSNFFNRGFNIFNQQVSGQGINSAQVIMSAPDAPIVVIA